MLIVTTTCSPHCHIRIDRCPCITRTRGASQAFYSLKHERFLTRQELMCLQGFRQGRIEAPETVTEHQMGGMVGNSQDVVLLSTILKPLLIMIFKT